MKKWLLASAILLMAPAATFAHGFDFSIGLGGIRFGTGCGYRHCDGFGPRWGGPAVIVEPSVTYAAPPPVVVSQPAVVVQPPVVYSAPPVVATPVYAAPPVVYAPPRVYSYPAGYGYAPAGYYYGR